MFKVNSGYIKSYYEMTIFKIETDKEVYLDSANTIDISFSDRIYWELFRRYQQKQQ